MVQLELAWIFFGRNLAKFTLKYIVLILYEAHRVIDGLAIQTTVGTK